MYPLIQKEVLLICHCKEFISHVTCEKDQSGNSEKYMLSHRDYRFRGQEIFFDKMDIRNGSSLCQVQDSIRSCMLL